MDANKSVDADANKSTAKTNNFNAKDVNNFNAAVYAALDDVHALQERLARGDVSPRRRSPHKHAVDASSSADARRSPSPPRSAVHSHKKANEPRRNEIVWVSKPLQRWRADGSVAEPLGALEFLRGATLADARALVDQFYPLPHKRAYVFYHPTLRVPIDESDEANVDPAGFQVLAIVALSPPVAASPLVQVEPMGASGKFPPPQKKREVSAATRTKPSATSAVSKRTVTAATSRTAGVKPSTQHDKQAAAVPEFTETRLSRKALGDGAVCDVVVREFHRDSSVSIKADVLDGEFAGRSTAIKWFARNTVEIITQERKTSADAPKLAWLDTLLRKLQLGSFNESGGVELSVALRATRRRELRSQKSHVDENLDRDVIDMALPPPEGEASSVHVAAFIETSVGDVKTKTKPVPNIHHANAVHVETWREQVVTLKKPALEGTREEANIQETGTYYGAQESFVKPSTAAEAPGRSGHEEAKQVSHPLFTPPDSGQSVNTVDTGGAVQYGNTEDIPRRVVTPATVDSLYPSALGIREPTVEGVGNQPEPPEAFEANIDEVKTAIGKISTTQTIADVQNSDEEMVGDHKPDAAGRPVSSQAAPTPTLLQPASLPEPMRFKSRTTSPAKSDRPAKIHKIDLKLTAIVTHDGVKTAPEPVANQKVEKDSLERLSRRQAFPPSQHYAKVVMDFIVVLYETAILSDPASQPQPQQVVQDAIESVPRVPQGVDETVSEVLISHTQFQSAFRHYGIDHSVMALNGVLFAIEEELSAWSNDRWEQAVEALAVYVATTLSRVMVSGAPSADGAIELRLFEAVLNFVADVLGWTKVTVCRLEIIEKAVDASFQNMAEVEGKRAFKLSDNERGLLSRIMSSIPTDSCTELERWLADGLEVLYFLVQKHFAILEDTKLQLLPTREQRVKWVIQKMVTLDPSVWRRMDLFVYPTVEDYTSWSIVEDRLRSFRRDRQHQNKLLDSDVFLLAFVRFLHNKASQVYLSISDMVASANPEVSSSLVQRYVVFMKREVEARSWMSSSLDGFLRAFGLKVCELEAVNMERKTHGLPRLNVSGRQSVHTAHQTKLMASIYGLHKKPRWDQPDMMPPLTQNWYSFHGDDSIALEYVYVRHSIDIRRLGPRWEDEVQLAEKEAAIAFHQSYTAIPTSKKPNVVCAIGLNVLHAHWLHEKIDFSSPKAVSAHPLASSLSIGFHLSRNEDIAAIRVTIRIHASTNYGSTVDESNAFTPTHNTVTELNRFVCSASEEALHSLVAMGGLRFLVQCLPRQREEIWKSIPFGLHFSSQIASCGLSMNYARTDIIFFLQSLLPLIPRSDSTITSYNLSLLGTIVQFSGSKADDDVAEAAVRTLVSLATHVPLGDTTRGVEDTFNYGSQKKFIGVDGLRHLKSAIDVLPASSQRRTHLEDALCAALTSNGACLLDGFLVHSGDWIKYFVEPESWMRSPSHVSVLLFVLDRLHTNVFSELFVERDQVRCGCGCRGQTPGNFPAFSAVMSLFCALMNSSPGRKWGLRNMQGALDLMRAIEWSARASDVRVSPSRNTLSATLFDILVEASMGSEMCMDACDLVVPRVLQLVTSVDSIPTKVSLLQLGGLLLDASLKLSLWKIAPSRFVKLVMALMMVIMGAQQQSYFTEIVANVVFHEDQSYRHSAEEPSAMSSLLCEEHAATTASKSSTNSIFQSLVLLLRQSAETETFSRMWKAPLLIGFISLFGSSAATQVLAEVGVESALHELLMMESNAEDQILTGRALAAFYLQTLSWGAWKVSPTINYSKCFAVIITNVQLGAKKSITRHQVNAHVGKLGEPLFGASIEDVVPVVSWYMVMASQIEEDRHEPSREEVLERIEGFWEKHEWRDLQGVESFLTHLKLLFVCSAVSPLIKSPLILGEVAQVFLFVLKFIRDRSHVPEHQVLLYISSLENLAGELGSGLQQMGFVSSIDIKLVERLLIYSRRTSPLLSRGASRALWALTAAFGDRDFVFHALSSILHLVDEDQVSTQKALAATSGVDIILGNITKKLAAHAEIEGDAATLALLLELDVRSAHVFFAKNRYSTALKLLSDGKIVLARGFRSTNMMQSCNSIKTGCMSYDIPTSRCERDMIQLGRLARSCLLVLARSDKAAHRKAAQDPSSGVSRELPFKLGDELNRTKITVVPLLRDEHPLIVEVAARCVLVHLKSEPQRSTELLEQKDLDRLFDIGLDCQTYGPLQAASLAVVRISAVDLRAREHPYAILRKLLQGKARLIQCLQQTDFQVMKQTIELLVLLLAKCDDPHQRSELASAFQEADSQKALSRAFSSLCGEYRDEGDSASVLQRLVGFVIQLDLVKLIDGDNMVEAMCLGIASHKGEGFLLPMICNCLWDIATQEGNVIHFARKSRLDAIVSLLGTSLTNGEARHIGATLRALATAHSGIQCYLSDSSSDCLRGIARVLGSFSRASAEDTSSSIVSSHTLDEPAFEDVPIPELTAQDVALPVERHLLRISVENQVLISTFTDEVYEEILGLLAVLLEPFESASERFGCVCSTKKHGCSACDPCDVFVRAGGPRLVTRFLLSRRIFIRLDDSNQRMIEATGSEAFTIVHLALQTLQVLSRSQRCRLDMLRGSTRRGGGWWSIMWLIERGKTSTAELATRLADIPVNALMILGHCAATPGVVDFLLIQREFLISLFAHLVSPRGDEHGIRCQRSASFLIARLAEHRKIARDFLFREKAAYLLESLAKFRDRIVQANVLILARNFNCRLPNDKLLNVVMMMLRSESAQDSNNWTVLHLVCDVLTHLLLIQRQPHERSSCSSAATTPPTSGSSASNLMVSVRTAMAPAWRSLFATFDDEDDSAEFQVLIDEARYLSLQLWPNSDQGEPIEALLDFLLHHHLPSNTENGAQDKIKSSKTDEIPLCGNKTVADWYHPSLQYVNSTAEQNTPHKPDLSFQGSVHVWRFVQLLWRFCANSRILRKQPSQQLPMDRVIGTLLLWGHGDSSDSLSSLSLERRQRLLKFVNEILRSSPDHCKTLQMRDIVSMLEVFASRSGSAGVGFELLFLMCRADTFNANRLAAQFAELKTESMEITDERVATGGLKPASSVMRVLWYAARAGYYDRAVPTSRVVRQSDDVASALHVLQPYVASPSTAFAMALLDTLSDATPDMLTQYLNCQSVFVLLELLLLTLSANDSASKSRHTLSESVLRLVRKTVVAEPNTTRFFRADPRLLLAVQRLVFAVKIPTQLAAVELLSCLMTRDPTISDVLHRLEDWTSCASSVQPWMVDTVEDHVTRLRLSTLSRKDVVEVAHLVQVPLFASVKTVDLTRLSVAFMESRLAEDDAFMVLTGVGIFSSAPPWMRGSAQGSANSSNTFSQIVEARKVMGLPVLLYKMQKDWYVGGSGMQARHCITREIEAHEARATSPLGHSTWLVSRLCRFLVEDRAELLRRVSYAKHISSCDASAQIHRRWDDTLNLLASSPVMDGVSRDSLACLALAMSEPSAKQLENLRGAGALILVYSECVAYEATLRGDQDEELASIVGHLRRGDMFGLPWGSRSTVRLRVSVRAGQVVAAELPEELVRSQLQPFEFKLVQGRCERTVLKDGEKQTKIHQWFEGLAAKQPSSQRCTLQLQSLGLMKTLVTQSTGYARLLAANSRVVAILFEVARSYLYPSLVDAAIDVLIAILSRNGTTISAADPLVVDSSSQKPYQPPSGDGNLDSWLLFATRLVQEAVEDGWRLQLPLQLLLDVLQIEPVAEIDGYARGLLPVLHAVFIHAVTTQQLAFHDRLSQVLQHLVDVCPTRVKVYCHTVPLHLEIVRLLAVASQIGEFVCFGRLLRLVVFFDGDPVCHGQLHGELLDKATQRVVQKVIADLYVESRLTADRVPTAVGTYLEFIDAYCQHVVKQQSIMRLEDPLYPDDTQQEALLLTARVVLDGFDRLTDQRSLVLCVVAQASEAADACADLAATCSIRDRHRSLSLRRWVSQRLQELPSSHTGSLTRAGEELVGVVSCLRAMSRVARAARHFVDHDFNEIAFRYLLHRPPDVIATIHLRVWTELLRALQAIALHLNQQAANTNLLHTHTEKLRMLHTRVVAVAHAVSSAEECLGSERYQLTAAYVDLLATLVVKADEAGQSLKAVPWLSVEVAYQCYEWIRQTTVTHADTKAPLSWRAYTALKLPLASLRFLTLLCSSLDLATMKMEQPAFPGALERMFDHATATLPTSLLFEGQLQYLCAVVEQLVAYPSSLLKELLPALLPQAVELTSRACYVSVDELRRASRSLDLSIRLSWLVVFAWREQRLGYDSALETSCISLLSTLSVLHGSLLTKRRTMTNVLGLVSTIVRLAVNYDASSLELREAITVTSSKLLSIYGSHPRDAIDENIAAALDWDAFNSHQWHKSVDASPQYGIDSLLMAILRGVISDTTMQRQWLQRDAGLKSLSLIGLPLALKLLGVCQSSRLVSSTHKKCVIFLRLVISLAMHLPHASILRSWRRTLRKSAFVDIAARFFNDPQASQELQLEVLHLLTVLTRGSVVDAIAFARHQVEGGRPFLHDLTALAMHSQGSQVLIACLDFFTVLAATSSQSAGLVASTLCSVGCFVQAIVDTAKRLFGEQDYVIAALIDCCGAISQHIPFAEEPTAAAVAMRRLSRSIENGEDSSSTMVTAGAVRLFHVLLSSGRLTMEDLLVDGTPGHAFWHQMRLLFKLETDKTTLGAAFAICSRLIAHGVGVGRAHSFKHSKANIEATLLKALVADDELGSALCVQWLHHQSFADVDEFVRSLCNELSRISALPEPQQRGLVRVLPTLLSVLERGRVKFLLTEDAWMKIRDVAFAWSSSPGPSDAVQYVVLCAVNALLIAKQLRVLHDAARLFRRACKMWNSRFIASSTRIIVRTAQDEATVALGIHVLMGVSMSLGLPVDKDATQRRVASLWLANSVYTAPRPGSVISQSLELMLTQCLDDKLTVDVSAVELACGAFTNECMRSILRICSTTQAAGGDSDVSQRLAVAMLRSPIMRVPFLELLQQNDFDLVNRLSWASWRYDYRSHAEITSTCELLGEVGAEAALMSRIHKRRLANQWIFQLTYAGDHGKGFFTSETNRAFLAFIVIIMRHHINHNESQLRQYSVWKPMVLHCVVTLQAETPPATSIKTLALELLAHLIQVDDALLRELWRVCLLLSSNEDAHDRSSAQGITLRALTDPLRHTSSAEDRRRAAFISYGLAASLRRATPLVQARISRFDADGGVDHSLSDQLTYALFMSAGTRVRRTLCVFPVDWSSASSIFPVSLTFVAADTATWVLRLLRKCLRDKTFVRGLAEEFDLFDQLFAALASSNVEVASAAAWVLRDATLLQSAQRTLARSSDQLENRQYRRLGFFADLRAHDHELFAVVPRTIAAQALPARFAAVELWILHYSRRMPELHSSQDARAHLEAVGEVALYMISQFFAQIFTPDADLIDENGDNTLFLCQAARERHTALCAALLMLGCRKGREFRRIRVLAVELLTALCAFETTKYSADLFLDSAQIAKLLGVIEQAESESERIAVVRLLRELLWTAPIKLQFAGASSSPLLQQTISWLSQPRFQALRAAATAILKQLVTKSPGIYGENDAGVRNRKLHAEQLQNMLMTTAKALFEPLSGTNPSTDTTDVVAIQSSESSRRDERADHAVVMSVRLMPPSDAVDRAQTDSSAPAAMVSVLLHFFIRDQQGVCVREFRYRGKLRTDRPLLQHEMLLEENAAVMCSDVILLPSSPPQQPKSSQQAVVERLTLKTRGAPAEVNHVQALQLPPSTSISVALKLSHHYSTVDTDSRGVLGRLLVDPSVPAQVISDSLSIITELSKSASIFSSKQLQLDRHIIAAMEASQRFGGHLDVSPLNALTAWFWSNRSSVTHFRSSWEPLLALVRRMRSASFIQNASPAQSSAQAAPALSGPTFLVSLMEWLATLESDSLTENCLNVLFFENGAVLVRLASHFYPQRTASANFFYLVATAVRVNRLHCEVFARTHALAIMTTMLDELPNSPADRQAETLEFAARVVAKITRVPTAADKFLRHGGMVLFGKIAFAVFGDLTDESFEQFRAAAQNLILASSFLCERVTNGLSLSTARSARTDVLALLTTRSAPAAQTLSLVETVLLFLARESSVGKLKRPRAPPCSSNSSFERLAAVVLGAWIEKWPTARGSIESTLFASADFASSPVESLRLVDDYAKAMCRCFQLTRWDFYSELNVVARTFSAAISAGVRTGVIPLKCRNVFLPFDSDFLETQRLGLAASTANAPHPNTAFTAVPSDVVQELRDVLRFVVDHTILAQTLSENRKKTLTSRIKVAESSSRVAMGFHTVLVVVYDTLVDALATVENHSSADDRCVEASRVILQWLTLLEELGGLLCCAFQELDPTYYEEIFRQMHTLTAHDLPAFLLKMERIQSREETVAVVMNNLERLLRRLASKHELRGATSLGASVAEHAEQLLDQYAQMKDQVSVAIALALSGRDAVNRVHRGIIAAEYAWRRVFGVSGETITSFMAGTEESESLWVKLRKYANAISEVLQHPGPILKARWLKLQALLKSLRHLLDSSSHDPDHNTKNENKVDANESPNAWSRGSGNHDDSSIRDDDGEDDNENQQLGEKERSIAVLLGIDVSLLLVSTVPFTALESLLDHYGFASSGVKKQIALLNFEAICARVLRVFGEALACEVSAVANMPAAELERALTQLHDQCLSSDDATADDVSEKLPRLAAMLNELQAIVDAADLGIHLRVVVQRPVKQSLWQLLLAPVRRARLFAVYHALRRRHRFDQDIAPHHTQLLLPLSSTVAIQPTGQAPPLSTFSAITETLTGGALFIKSSVLEALEEISRQPQPATVDRQKNRRIAVANDTSTGHDPFVLLATETVTSIVRNSSDDDPLSDEKLVAALKRKLRLRRQKQQQESRAARLLGRFLPAKWRYTTPPAALAKTTGVWRRLKRRVALILLLLAFWRQEELESDLTNPILARAFATPTEREDYFVSTHLRKAFDEFVRVWMPESGSLGLPMWQWKAYGLGGTLLCVVLAFVGPLVASGDTSKRNDVMTSLTYALVGVTLLLCAKSIHSITQKHFVLQERNRLRLQPLGKYYPNVIAIVTVLVEIVQLNSITFDPKFNWNETDQLPKLLTWLGKVGISQIGIQQVELKAALCAVALLVWFLLLKCANKFQESNPFLNRVVTKDLPGVLNGTLYMGLVATFFAFLSCVDCDGPYGYKFEKCNATTPPPPPFLLSHQSISCWTATHAPLSLLGFWGVTFFLPIGLLSQGMNQVLFQQEVLDIKYAPVVLLFSQLVKAVAATARALFPFDTTLLASVALAGNVLLLVLILRPKGASLWYVQLIKGGIYAASGWSAACAIYRVSLNATSSVSNNIVYMGWLAIGAVTVAAVRVWGWRREERENEELAKHLTSQRALAVTASSADGVHALTSVESKFIRAAAASIARPNRRAKTLLEQADKFAANHRDDDDAETVPAELRPLMRRARAFASGKQTAFGVTEAVFMQNARKRAKKLDANAALASVLRAKPKTE